ncbi:MAG TPA: hypothetical protein GXZ82_09245 [Firmicutes bacterium]|jgi:Tfp pilus assembly protein PilO|nr:hypothetical protein [Bacillota bacterium]
MIRLNASFARSRLSNRDQVILFILINLVALLLFIFLVYKPSMRELSLLRDENTETQRTMQLLEAAKQEHTALHQDYMTVVRSAANTLSQFPRESDLPAIMALVDTTLTARGAKTEVITYSQVQWDKGLGRSQMNAVFSGGYATIASLLVDLPRLFPAAFVEQMRITPVYGRALDGITGSEQAADEASVVAELGKALGLSHHMTSDAVVTSAHELEAQLVLTIYIAGNADATMPNGQKAEKGTVVQVAQLEQLLEGQGSWYPPVINRWRALNINPFNPSDKAIEVVNTIRLVEQYQDVKVTGVVQVGNQWAAAVQYQGESKTLRIGDQLDQARVTDITGQGITLDILGQSIFIQLGGVS